ncbi:hypothetical protein EV128_11174 [Rhizobium azibense]|nr:hypothetical protein EV128_11174 [Rhizobium azibense]
MLAFSGRHLHSFGCHRCPNCRARTGGGHEVAETRESDEIDLGEIGPAGDGEEVGVRGSKSVAQQEGSAPGKMILDEFKTLGDLPERYVLRLSSIFTVKTARGCKFCEARSR